VTVRRGRPPLDRLAVMRLLAEKGVATTTDVQAALHCSAPTARRVLESLASRGIGKFENPGPPSVGTLTLVDPKPAEGVPLLSANGSLRIVTPEGRPALTPSERAALKAECDRARRELIETQAEADRQLFADEATG
jgi:hypothetical protein